MGGNLGQGVQMVRPKYEDKLQALVRNIGTKALVIEPVEKELYGTTAYVVDRDIVRMSVRSLLNTYHVCEELVADVCEELEGYCNE